MAAAEEIKRITDPASMYNHGPQAGSHAVAAIAALNAATAATNAATAATNAATAAKKNTNALVKILWESGEPIKNVLKGSVALALFRTFELRRSPAR